MALSQALTRFGILISTVALLAPVGTLAGEQHLDFKFVVHPIDVKVVEATNIAGRTLSAGKYFGVAYFSDGRIAVKDSAAVEAQFIATETPSRVKHRLATPQFSIVVSS